jgi:hypothetical protein
MECWNDGILECWVEITKRERISKVFPYYSTIPFFQYSKLLSEGVRK